MNEEKHIFLVEDELYLRQTLVLILRKCGYRVTALGNGKEAFKKLLSMKRTSQKIDLLVTDIQVPGLNGIEIIDKLSDYNIDLPCLVITGFGDKKTVIELMRKGCAEYLDKPFDPDEFIKRVNIVLGKERLKNKKGRQKRGDKHGTPDVKRKTETYRYNYYKLQRQIDRAAQDYRELIEIGKVSHKFPIALRFKPLSDIGGDFVDIKDNPNGCDILVADVAGHDMGASYHAVMIKALFDEHGRNGGTGAEFFKHLNDQLIEHGKVMRMVTALFLRLDTVDMSGEVVSAAHPPPVCSNPGPFELKSMVGRGNILGIDKDTEFCGYKFPIRPGQRFFLYTDGIINICRVDGPSGKRMRLRRGGLKNLIGKYDLFPLKKMVEFVWSDILAFSRYKPIDDMLLLGAEIPGGSNV